MADSTTWGRRLDAVSVLLSEAKLAEELAAAADADAVLHRAEAASYRAAAAKLADGIPLGEAVNRAIPAR